MSDSGAFRIRREPDCALVPRKYERHVSRIGSVSGGLGRGAHGFWTKVRKLGESPGGCWEWIGYLDKDGYGKFCSTLLSVDGTPRTARSHRIAWQLANGPVPAGLLMLHRCDNAACVNPDHLRPGTQKENIRECYERGRHANRNDTRGEMSGRTKLRNEDVLFMRSQERVYGLAPVLAKLYGVRPAVVAGILTRRTWKHLGNGNKQNAMPLAQLRALAEQREPPKQTRLLP